MDYESKKNHYVQFINNKQNRKRRMIGLLFSIFFLLASATTIAIIVYQFYDWGFYLFALWFLIPSIIVVPISIIVMMKSSKIQVKAKSDFDLFVVAEMKGITKKLKSKGVSLNIDKKEIIEQDPNSDSSNSNLEKLEKLYDLLQKGAITEEEYQELKKEVLLK
jgi:uncharacterized membrane protein